MPAKPNKYTTEYFIKMARMVHGNKYDYSKVVYKNSCTKVIIICPIHGKFSQTPHNHLNGQDCPKCWGKNIKLTTEEFIIRAKKVHGNCYGYSKVVYIAGLVDVIIICPDHGEFHQMPFSHLNGQGCPKCARNQKLTTEEFIIRARKVHENKYDYSKVDYVNSDIDVIIICPFHGEFLQRPSVHIHQKQGCPHCRKSKGEIKISKILENTNIEYIRQKSFKDCINPKTKHRLKYDFYLPLHNMLIEFNGQQHYINNGYWHTNKYTFANQQYRDSIKKSYALSHGYRFLVIKYTENIEQALKSVIDI